MHLDESGAMKIIKVVEIEAGRDDGEGVTAIDGVGVIISGCVESGGDVGWSGGISRGRWWSCWGRENVNDHGVGRP